MCVCLVYNWREYSYRSTETDNNERESAGERSTVGGRTDGRPSRPRGICGRRKRNDLAAVVAAAAFVVAVGDSTRSVYAEAAAECIYQYSMTAGSLLSLVGAVSARRE